MGTQILTGSQGNYKLLNKTDKVFLGNPEFVVTKDTCSEAEKLPVKFRDAAEGCWIYMHEAEFTMKNTREY